MNEKHVAIFWSKMTIGDGCWTHRGSKGSHGYPQATWGKRSEPAHRVAWEITNGAVPNGAFVCHHCDNKSCARPSHLYLGTHKENMRDMRVRERNTRKVTRAQAALIRDDKRAQRVIADEYGVHQATVWNIKHGRTHF